MELTQDRVHFFLSNLPAFGRIADTWDELLPKIRKLETRGPNIPW